MVDAGGWPLLLVSVTARSDSDGIVRRVTTGRDGVYRFGSLPDGTYRVDFDYTGFNLVRQNHVRVGVGAIVNATLRPRPICECVTYTGLPALRERAGNVVDEAGRPLPHAHLTLVAPIGGLFPTSSVGAYADEAGHFAVRVPVNDAWPVTGSDSGFMAETIRVSGAADAPIVIRLRSDAAAVVPDIERFDRGCQCSDDLFTHAGRRLANKSRPFPDGTS
jgi:hypothetical protein